MTEHERTRNTHTIRIWQQNLNKSLDAQSHFLHTLRPDEFDVALIQEPYMDRLTLTRATTHWSVVYPSRHHDQKEHIRSVMLVNARIPTNSWEIIHVESSDITAIRLQTPQEPLYIFNVYNAQEHQHTIQLLSRRLAGLHLDEARHQRSTRRNALLAPQPTTMYYSRETSIDITPSGNPLVKLLAEFDLYQLLPAGISTLSAFNSGNLTRPDNVFGSIGLVDALLSCRVPAWLIPNHTDHFPIHIHLDFAVTSADHPPRWNWRATDPKKFLMELTAAFDHNNSSKKLASLPRSTQGQAGQLARAFDWSI
ncbi:hypothetical protein NM688_g5868 [Phlebia brevispora]|uniref:Uncharacterized protein n=1 Tax=Phlebia brevispora TaxID=194682 RepID=A0ACC1SND6_9APHY|nr:hypothetical protein NM688_g5868 [Phlebia brevispora]